MWDKNEIFQSLSAHVNNTTASKNFILIQIYPAFVGATSVTLFPNFAEHRDHLLAMR
jgi:hypothetical protein